MCLALNNQMPLFVNDLVVVGEKKNLNFGTVPIRVNIIVNLRPPRGALLYKTVISL